ncbi:MAG: outer membrane beta-barrel protein [Ferruginibacter sp.]
MKKIVFSAVVICCLLQSAQAQRGSDLKFQFGFNVGVPAHNLGGTSLGLGVDLLGHYKASPDVAITGDLGYTALLAKNNGSTSNLVPLRIGLRYYPATEFYVGGKFGAGFISNRGSSVTSTAYSVGFGYLPSNRVELGASYDGYSKNGTIGLLNLRVGVFL